ncbi:metalloregulator ArsR/SmtB family transcription factor [Patescibacteria group bacterium]|nr:metalloregulator ArsR/SmtB family transcription factor [Patescibacteria group bacterium]
MRAKCCENKELTKRYFDLAKFLRIIGDNNRLKILCLLKDNDLYVEQLSFNLDLAQNLVSSHLKVMVDFDLLIIKQKGKKNYYSINKNIFKKYNKLLINFLKNYER